MIGQSESGGLSVLITNTSFALRTGSELYVRDLALALQGLGHRPVVYSPRLGALAEELRGRAIPVVDDLDALGQAPDLIHGQHHLETMTALARFPQTPALFACHGCLPWQESPPLHPRILRYLAVNEAVRDRLLFEAGVTPDKITTVLNFVDLRRFAARPSLPKRPLKALIFSNYASEANYVGTIRECCERRGISLDVAGYASGNPWAAPERMLGNYDLIFARGRAAIEGLAVGAALICCDHEGLGEMVTPQNLDRMRRNNFGLRVLDRPLRTDLVDEQIDRYDPQSAAQACLRLRASAGLDLAVEQIVGCYRVVLGLWRASGGKSDSPDAPALSRYLRQVSMTAQKLSDDAIRWRHGHSELAISLERERFAAGAVEQERDALRIEADRLRRQADHEQQQALEQRTELESVRAQLQFQHAQTDEQRLEADRLRVQANGLREDAATQGAITEHWRDAHAEAAVQTDELRRQLDELHRKLDELHRQLEDGHEAAAGLVAEIESRHAAEQAQQKQALYDIQSNHAVELAASHAEATQLRAVIRRLHETLTWRLRHRLLAFTPLRRAYQFLRTMRAGPLAVAAAATPAADASLGDSGDTDQTQLACVVMGLGNPASLVAAVRSLQSQDRPVEIVVVNSGGGNPIARFRAAGIDVKVVHRADVLYPGAARNLGIAATRAPFVAFLAADCLAEPGWVRARIERHACGHRAVSSAVTPARPRNLWSWVSYLGLFALRMPGVPAGRALHYGVSYQRILFGQFGLFKEYLRSGEDSEFNQRLTGVEFAWTPEVRSAHAHPTSLVGLLRDQFGRGARIAAAWERISGTPSRRVVAINAFRRVPGLLRCGWQAAEAGQHTYIAIAGFLMPPAILAYALGALLGAPPAQNPPRHASTKPRLLALLTFHNEMSYLPDYFLNLAPHVDGVIALDDGSDDGSGEFVESQASVRELIRLPRRTPHVWDEPRNRRLLVEAALRHDADWLVVVDADERVERDFRSRADMEMSKAEADGQLVLTAVMRELWNHADHFRCDGIWNSKRPARLFKARQDHQFDDRCLHGYWAPLNSLTETTCREADLIIYHLRMLTEAERSKRQAKYQRLDPDRQFQAIGYDYLTDTAELRLQRLPSQREYRPLHPA